MTIGWGSGSLRSATRAISRAPRAPRRPRRLRPNTSSLLTRLLAEAKQELVKQHEAWVKQQ